MKIERTARHWIVHYPDGLTVSYPISKKSLRAIRKAAREQRSALLRLAAGPGEQSGRK